MSCARHFSTPSGRGIPPRGVAHRPLMLNRLALRALTKGRLCRHVQWLDPAMTSMDLAPSGTMLLWLQHWIRSLSTHSSTSNGPGVSGFFVVISIL